MVTGKTFPCLQSSFISVNLSCFEKKPLVYRDNQSVLFEDDVADELVSEHRCLKLENTRCIALQLDHLLLHL